MRRKIMLLAVMAMLAGGCGLKVPYEGGAAATADGITATGASGSVDGAAAGDLAGGSASGATASGEAGGDAGGSGGAGGAAAGGKGAVSSTLGLSSSCQKAGFFPKECEGISKDSITVCSHLPITGAAPIPRDPRRFGAFYFDYVNKELGGIHGRKVRWLAYDDQYNPTQAQQQFERCRSEGSFVITGAAGTDQIVAVAKRANALKIPYLHGPAASKEIGGLKYSMFIGPDYESQHRLLADYVIKNAQTISGKAKPVLGMIRVNSPFFDAGHDAFVDQLKKKGFTLAVDRKVEKDESSFGTLLAEFASNQVDVINNFTTPTIWLKMLQQKPSSYNPTFVAVSPVAGYNLIAQALANSGSKAVIFHHSNPVYDESQSVAWRPSIDEFIQIFNKYKPAGDDVPRDDFDYNAYLAAKFMHQVLLALGPDPTRTKLWQYFEKLKMPKPDIAKFPMCPLDFTRKYHMGSYGTNVFELRTGRWQQIATCIESA